MAELKDRPHVWKGPGSEGPSPLDSLDDTPHVWKRYTGEGKNVLDSLKTTEHVWRGPGTEGPNVIDSLDSDRWKWRGPGTESDPRSLLGKMRAGHQTWRGYKPPVNVLAALPTCIGLGCPR